jgi:hypothetical protein
LLKSIWNQCINFKTPTLSYISNSKQATNNL